MFPEIVSFFEKFTIKYIEYLLNYSAFKGYSDPTINMSNLIYYVQINKNELCFSLKVKGLKCQDLKNLCQFLDSYVTFTNYIEFERKKYEFQMKTLDNLNFTNKYIQTSVCTCTKTCTSTGFMYAIFTCIYIYT